MLEPLDNYGQLSEHGSLPFSLSSPVSVRQSVRLQTVESPRLTDVFGQ